MKQVHFTRWLVVSCLGFLSACSSEPKSSNTVSDAGTGNENTLGAGGTQSTTNPDVDAGSGDANAQPDAGDAGTNAVRAAPSIAGSYVDTWGYSTIITADTWTLAASDGTSKSVFHLTLVDNASSFAIAQNDAQNSFSPGLWSRFDWTTDSASAVWYCQTTYDAPSAEAAQQTPPANAQDLATGCGSGFPWTQLIPES